MTFSLPAGLPRACPQAVPSPTAPPSCGAPTNLRRTPWLGGHVASGSRARPVCCRSSPARPSTTGPDWPPPPSPPAASTRTRSPARPSPTSWPTTRTTRRTPASASSPPRDEQQAAHIALEHLLTTADNIVNDPPTPFPRYAASLVDAPLWRFWWD
ncbi:DUF4253 domain-containing protein [Streptomyces sp. GbtcB7]|uniref:DUF4253 domain-containing protein n=1 Tax=Streptomyces sp. GbtcB7 TaxID=2824752 RepID=UPI001C30E84B|nr:DUF4253 domain-containing protein [Streptomyces sp. GbtcB7]